MANSNEGPERIGASGGKPRGNDPERDAGRDTERERAGGPLSTPDAYGANEREQTVERERVGRTRLDEAGEVTDAEIEAREQQNGGDSNR